MRGLIALGGAAVVVIAGVLAVAEVVLPQTAATTIAAAAAGEAPVTPPGSVATVAPDDPRPLSGVGGTIDVTGDTELTIILNPTATGPSQNGPYRLSDGGRNWLMLGYDSGRITIGQASIDGGNFFPDPDECDLRVTEKSESLGLARLSVACAEITDVPGTTTVALHGHADVALVAADPDGAYRGGGTLTFTAGEPAEWEFDEATWVTYPGTEYEDEFVVYRCDGEAPTCFGLTFTSSQGQVAEESVVAGDVTYTSASGCAVDVTELHPLGPDIDYVEIHLDCPDLVDADGNQATLTGTLRAHKLRLYFP